jgi:hypothetical protein
MKISGLTSIYHKLVFEVRYDFGLLYLDRCGATANRIMETFPEWVLQDESVNPQNAPLINVTTGTHFNFGGLKYDFNLDQPIREEAALTPEDIKSFFAQVDSVSRIVHEELELKHFTREGFRVWYVFGTQSEEESHKWISSLGVFKIGESLPKAFSGKLDNHGHVVIVSAKDRKFRISVTAVERTEQLDIGSHILRIIPRKLPAKQREVLVEKLKAKRRLLANPSYGVMIDVDAYIERPIEIAPVDFMTRSIQMIEESLPVAFSGGGS